MKKILLMLLIATTTVLAHHVDKVYCEGNTKVIDIETGHTGNSTGYIYYTVYDKDGKVIQAEKREKTGVNGHTIIKINFSIYYKVKFRCSKGDWNYTMEVKTSDLCNVTLPVKIYDLRININNNIQTLTWNTADEKNFSHFEIQTTQNLFEVTTIGSTMVNSFDIPLDVSNNNKTNYYRLKSIDLDNSYDYTKWISYDASQKEENMILLSKHKLGDLYSKNRQGFLKMN